MQCSASSRFPPELGMAKRNKALMVYLKYPKSFNVSCPAVLSCEPAEKFGAWQGAGPQSPGVENI